jgi:hypothetical protein
VHVLFTQPVNQSGVPSQNVEHILGEVYVDSLAVPASEFQAPTFDLCGTGSSTLSKGKKPAAAKKKSAGVLGATSGGSSAGGSTASGSSSSGSASSQPAASYTSGSGSGSSEQLTSSGTTGTSPQSFPASVIKALHKPVWLLVAYLVWQALMIGTGWGIWKWHKGVAS